MLETIRYRIDLPVFSGPLDLLLHLIERAELDITAISLAHVTEQYLNQVEVLKENKIEQLIDFLVIGARLVLIKSRALLPRPAAPPATNEEEEDPAEALIRQLQQYKQFKEVAQWLHNREEQGLRSYLRVAPPLFRPEGKLDLTGITVQTLLQAMRSVLARQEKLEESVALVQPRRITIEGQISHLRQTLGDGRPRQFQQLLSDQADRVEIAITLLALLELIKRRETSAHQPFLFGPITLSQTNHSQLTGDSYDYQTQIG